MHEKLYTKKSILQKHTINNSKVFLLALFIEFLLFVLIFAKQTVLIAEIQEIVTSKQNESCMTEHIFISNQVKAFPLNDNSKADEKWLRNNIRKRTSDSSSFIYHYTICILFLFCIFIVFIFQYQQVQYTYFNINKSRQVDF